jgi:hypothetical protein
MKAVKKSRIDSVMTYFAARIFHVLKGNAYIGAIPTLV